MNISFFRPDYEPNVYSMLLNKEYRDKLRSPETGSVSFYDFENGVVVVEPSNQGLTAIISENKRNITKIKEEIEKKFAYHPTIRIKLIPLQEGN